MRTTVTGLTGEYRVTHPERIEASVVVKMLEQDGKTPFRSMSKGDGVSLALGGGCYEIGGEYCDVVIFGNRIGVIPAPLKPDP